MREIGKKFSQIWECDLKLWRELKGWKLFLFYTLHYTVLFFVLSYFVFAAFRETEKLLIWTTDGMPQYFTGMVYISKTIRNAIQALFAGDGWTFPLYDFTAGPFRQAIQAEPLVLLAVLCPWNQIDKLISILVLLRFYIAGISFSMMGFYFRQRPMPILIGAVSYVFCGFTIFGGIRQHFFMLPVIILPILIVGAEELLKGGRGYLFTAVVCIALLSNLYFSYMLAILIVIYIFVRYFCAYAKDGIRGFGRLIARMVCWGGCGILLSGVTTLPAILQNLDTGRVGNHVTGLLTYPKSFYQDFLSSYTMISDEVASWTLLGFSSLIIPAILLLFTDKNRKKFSLKVLYLLSTAMICSPAVAYVMSGFNTLSGRWCFGYALCCSSVIMFELPLLETADRKTLAVVGGGVTAYIGICYCFTGGNYHVEPLIFLAVMLSVGAFCFYAGTTGRKIILPICLVFACACAAYSGYLKYDSSAGNYAAEFTSKGQPYSHFKNSQYGAFARSKASEDSGFYRVGCSNLSYQSMGSAFYYDINGLTGYSSYIFPQYLNWIEDQELSKSGAMLHRLYGLRSRAHLLTMAGVKYYVQRENGDGALPYGFQEIQRIKNGTVTEIIGENEYALPLGYTYDSYLPHDEYEKLSGPEKQEALMQAVMLGEGQSPNSIPEASIDLLSQKIPVEITNVDGVTWNDRTLKVTEENATMELAFQGFPNANTYLRIVNLDLTAGSSTRRWTLTASTPSLATVAAFDADGWIYSHGIKTQLLDLGYSEEGCTTCTITFPSKGTFILDDLQIWCQPMDHYGDQVNALREEILENVETNWHGLTGDIAVSKDKILCLSIPYDNGWSAYVDGQKVEVLQANTAFMAVELEAGDHHVELKYWTPGLTSGIILSAVGLVGLASLIVYWRKKRS